MRYSDQFKEIWVQWKDAHNDKDKVLANLITLFGFIAAGEEKVKISKPVGQGAPREIPWKLIVNFCEKVVQSAEELEGRSEPKLTETEESENNAEASVDEKAIEEVVKALGYLVSRDREEKTKELSWENPLIDTLDAIGQAGDYYGLALLDFLAGYYAEAEIRILAPMIGQVKGYEFLRKYNVMKSETDNFYAKLNPYFQDALRVLFGYRWEKERNESKRNPNSDGTTKKLLGNRAGSVQPIDSDTVRHFIRNERPLQDHYAWAATFLWLWAYSKDGDSSFESLVNIVKFIFNQYAAEQKDQELADLRVYQLLRGIHEEGEKTEYQPLKQWFDKLSTFQEQDVSCLPLRQVFDLPIPNDQEEKTNEWRGPDGQLALITSLYMAWGFREYVQTYLQQRPTLGDDTLYLPIPVLYYPSDEPADIKGLTDEKLEKRKEETENLRKSVVWDQFNAIMWVAYQDYPFAQTRSSIEDRRKASTLHLLRDWLAEEAWLQSGLAEVLGETIRDAPEKRGQTQPSLGRTVYSLLDELTVESRRIARVGIEEHPRIYPGISVQVARAALPLMGSSTWMVYKDYLGEEDWGVLGDVRRYFCGETAPSGHLVMLVGPYGTGKSSMAQAIVQGLVDINPPDWYILAPKAEKQALELLPVNRYNIFYLFRRAELSRVALPERIAELDYFIPPDKNIIVNYAELNATHSSKLRDRLSDLEIILRELREKAIPRRIIVLMALNYAGLYKELPDFLARRPDLSMAGARLSHVWVLQTTEQKILGVKRINERIDKKNEENKESKAEGGVIKKIDAAKVPAQLFMEHYFRYRFLGRDYMTRRHTAIRYLIRDIAHALINEKYQKESERDQTRASGALRLPLVRLKASLLNEALQSPDLGVGTAVFPILEEIQQRSYHSGQEHDGYWGRFLEAWGVTHQALAQYIGNHALIRMMLRQGFVRNFTDYMARELAIRLVERQAAVALSDNAGTAPLAKYHEIIAMSELMEGMLSKDVVFNVVRNCVVEEAETRDDFIIDIVVPRRDGDDPQGASDSVGKILEELLPDKPGKKGKPIEVAELESTDSQVLFSLPFAGGDDTSLFDGAFYIRGKKDSHHLLLIDVTKMSSDGLDTHNRKKLRVLRDAQESSFLLSVVGDDPIYFKGKKTVKEEEQGCDFNQCRKGYRVEFAKSKNVSFWDFSRALVGIIEGKEPDEGDKNVLWQLDIQFNEKEKKDRTEIYEGSLLHVQSVAFWVNDSQLSQELTKALKKL